MIPSKSKDLGLIMGESKENQEYVPPAVGFVAKVEIMTGFFNRDFWEWDNNE